jgi:hypothetical protein
MVGTSDDVTLQASLGFDHHHVQIERLLGILPDRFHDSGAE